MNHTVRSLNENLRFIFSVSLGIFMFILFFQPFPLEKFGFNNGLLFVAGFSAITFLLTFLLIIIYPLIIRYRYKDEFEPLIPVNLGDFVYVVLCSAAYSFYLRYVGGIAITFYIVFKIAVICTLPAVVMRIYDRIRELRNQNEEILAEKNDLQKRIDKYEDDSQNRLVEFASENKSENLTIHAGDIVLIKSADNYVEIIFKEGDHFKKKLIRNTMKNIEHHLKQYSIFIRCHRICIVNVNYVLKLNTKYSNYWLTISGIDEEIPVSRQYLLRLKEAIQ